MSLTPAAARHVAREAAEKPFGIVARCLSEDWHDRIEASEVQRWAERLGQEAIAARDAALAAAASVATASGAASAGSVPAGPANPPDLLVMGLDGGRVQMREKDPESQSRWREDKVASFTRYLPGDGHDREPKKLVTTLVATMAGTEEFGKMVRAEATARGAETAKVVLNISDGAAWIDGVEERERISHVRILDFYHASEYLYEAARAAAGGASPAAETQGDTLRDWLREGKRDAVFGWLDETCRKLGEPEESDGDEHPRYVVRRSRDYLQRRREQMQYEVYRGKGWPIGSGITESAVKQFNKRVKGTEQFWQPDGVEAILTLRALWRSEDQRWDRYWKSPRMIRKAA